MQKAAIAVAFLVLVTVQHSHGDIYIAEPVEGYPDGWSFDGAVFTVQDGFSGLVTRSTVSDVITDWTVNFTSPVGTHTLTPENSVPETDEFDSGLVIDGSRIFLDYDLANKNDPTFRQNAGLAFFSFSDSTVAVWSTTRHGRLALDPPVLNGVFSAPRDRAGSFTLATAIPEPKQYVSMTVISCLVAFVCWSERRKKGSGA